MPEPLYYEDCEIGRRYETAAREVTLREFELFAEVEGHKGALHLDEAYARDHSVFGKLTAHGVAYQPERGEREGRRGDYQRDQDEH